MFKLIQREVDAHRHLIRLIHRCINKHNFYYNTDYIVGCVGLGWGWSGLGVVRVAMVLYGRQYFCQGCQ
jgi:hypothetical protein